MTGSINSIVRNIAIIACGIFILWGVKTLLSSLFSIESIEAADLFAVFFLSMSCIAIVWLCAFCVEKITGWSLMSGIEKLGKHTLRGYVFCLNKCKDMLGIEVKKNNRKVKNKQTPPNVKLDVIHKDRQEVIAEKSQSAQENEHNQQVARLKREEQERINTERKNQEVAPPIIKPSTAPSVENNKAKQPELKPVIAREIKEAVETKPQTIKPRPVQTESFRDNTPSLPLEPQVDLRYEEEKLEFDNNENISDDLEPLDIKLNALENEAMAEEIEQGNREHEPDPIASDEIFNFGLLAEIQERAEQATADIIAGLQVNNNIEPESEITKVPVKEIKEYQLPTVELLDVHTKSIKSYSEYELEEMSRTVEKVLLDYKVSVEVMGAYPGPVITRFELSLAPGVKVSRVSGLSKDLARAMRVTSVRVVEIIAGTSFVGLEIPNQERELVSFREIISSDVFQNSKSVLSLSLGKDVSGKTVVSDLAKMPHLLVAGTTGSGKSVAINTMILSLLYKATPEQVQMIMIDPKMLELSVYEDIPHLLTPVVTDMKEAHSALRWAVAEMERRYKLMSKVGVRSLEGFNQKIIDAEVLGEGIRDPLYQLTKPLEAGEYFPTLSTLPNIVIVIDELADMMMIVGKKVEDLIARLAQKARASGIHLILATQRPSVDVLTGLIKANVPTRLSFQVSSRIDSRTILDQGGAESLLGNGDMLFLPSGTSIPIRAHGAFVDDDEVHRVVDFLKTQGTANYLSEILRDEEAEATSSSSETEAEADDARYAEAVDLVFETNKASISWVQRRLKVGYNRAARMIEQMEDEGLVSAPEGNGSRTVIRRE